MGEPMEPLGAAVQTVVTQATATSKSDSTANSENGRAPKTLPSLPPHIRLERMLQLPETFVLLAAREQLYAAWKERTNPGSMQEREVKQRLAKLDGEIDEAATRDDIQAGRPEGCVCLGTGRIPHRVRMRDPGVGPWCGCSDGEHAQYADAAERLTWEGDLLEKRRAQLVKDITNDIAQTDPHFLDFTLDTYLPEPSQVSVYQRMVRWSHGEGRSILLYGAASRGKTGLCIAALRARVSETACSGLYWGATALLTELIRGFRPRDGDAPDPVERAERVRYLLLDDIDKIAETPFKLQTIYDLINKRHNAGLATLFTANCNPTQLEEKLGAWSVDRIREMCGTEWVLELGGANRRLAA